MDTTLLKRKIAALFPKEEHLILSEKGQGYVEALLKVLELLGNDEDV